MPTYKYNVNGTDYFVTGFGQAKEEKINKETTVYYNPNDPKESYVDKEQKFKMYKVFKILGICFLIVDAILIIIKIIIND